MPKTALKVKPPHSCKGPVGRCTRKITQSLMSVPGKLLITYLPIFPTPKLSKTAMWFSKLQREIQILFVAQENTVQGDHASIPCSQVLQMCACLMQHALNRRVHRGTHAHVQQCDLLVCSKRVSLSPAENVCADMQRLKISPVMTILTSRHEQSSDFVWESRLYI